MASNFAKLDKFEGVGFRRWQKKMHFLLPNMSVLSVLTTPIPEDRENATMEGIRKRNIHLRIEESLRVQDNEKPKSNNVAGPSVVNMIEHNNSFSNQMFMLNIVNDNIGSTFMPTSKPNDSIIWHAKLGHVHFKRMQDMFKDGLITAFDMDTEKCKTCMLTKISKKLFQNVKRETEVLELIHSDLCDLFATPSLGNKKYFVIFIDDAYRTDRGGQYMNTLYFQPVGIIHEATVPYTPQQNDISKRKNRVLKEIANFMLSYSELSLRAVVRLFDPKLKTLGKRGIECIFVGYAEHSKAFRFYVIEPIESISINSIIESRDIVFDENRFSLVPRPGLRIPNRTKDTSGIRDEVSNKHSYCFSVEDDPKIFDEAIKSQDVAFWKEAINDEMDSIMGNNTWVLADLPSG
ncbi:zinc finger, CCHC-type containing protein [Tanacetum coccineum]